MSHVTCQSEDLRAGDGSIRSYLISVIAQPKANVNFRKETAMAISSQWSCLLLQVKEP